MQLQLLPNEYDGIAHAEILLPQNAPQEFSNRSVLWNNVEKIEKSKNSQLAREIEIALPKELDREKQINLVRDYVILLFNRSMVISIFRPQKFVYLLRTTNCLYP